jgi:hypothetical protein
MGMRNSSTTRRNRSPAAKEPSKRWPASTRNSSPHSDTLCRPDARLFRAREQPTQNLVAGKMTVLVVVQLEVVNIEQRKRVGIMVPEDSSAYVCKIVGQLQTIM